MGIDEAWNPAFEKMPMLDADVRLWRGFMDARAAAESFARLEQEIAWTQGEVSFGRTYKIPRLQAWIGDPGCTYVYSRMRLELGSGDLLVMAGATQKHWQHQVPKTSRPVGARINLTFRWIGTTAA